jgi:ketosteroid isomerase-like protein
MPLANRRVAALAALLATAALPLTPARASCSTAPASASITEANRRTVSDAFARWAAGGTTFFRDVLTDDVVWTIEGSGPSAGVYRGMPDFIDRAVQPFVSRLSSPVRPTAYRIWADGEHVIVNWQGSATARDGQPYANRYAWIFRMHEGKAVEVTAFLDLAPYDDVLCRVPAPQP